MTAVVVSLTPGESAFERHVDDLLDAEADVLADRTAPADVEEAVGLAGEPADRVVVAVVVVVVVVFQEATAVLLLADRAAGIGPVGQREQGAARDAELAGRLLHPGDRPEPLGEADQALAVDVPEVARAGRRQRQPGRLGEEAGEVRVGRVVLLADRLGEEVVDRLERLEGGRGDDVLGLD